VGRLSAAGSFMTCSQPKFYGGECGGIERKRHHPWKYQSDKDLQRCTWGAVLGSVAPGQFDRLGLAARRAPLERAGRHRGQPHSIPRGNSATLPSAPRAGDVPGPKWIRESATPTETGRSAVAHVSSRGRSPGSVASAGNSAAEGPGPVTLPSASHRGFLGAEWQFEIRGPIWKNWA